ncbi:MAG: hypothetical protein ISS76_16480 [Phycisphaerae bacterium]|nr:hypothetical protein [Phycisphaerae bacterium]
MAKKLKTSPVGRKCNFPKCRHLLSIYNHEAYCHVHRDQMAGKRTLTTIPYHHSA